MAHTPRLHWPDPIASGETLELADERAHHLLRVLKRREGDTVVLFQQPDREFDAQIVSVSKNRLNLKVGAQRTRSSESPLQSVLVQGISRGDRMDYSIQKSVELGVHQIIPVLTQRSGVQLDAKRLEKKQAHWQGVALSAAEQSGRTVVPQIATCQKLTDYLASRYHQGVVLDPLGEPWDHLKAPLAAEPFKLLIGPEGGLSDDEIALAARMGMQRLRLGPRILRTETAAVVALSALQLSLGDLSA